MASKSIDWDELLLTNDPKKKEIEVSFKKVDGDGFIVSKGKEPGTPAGAEEDPNGDDNGMDDDGDGVDDGANGGDDVGGDGDPIPGDNPECAPADCNAYIDWLADGNLKTTGGHVYTTPPTATADMWTATTTNGWRDSSGNLRSIHYLKAEDGTQYDHYWTSAPPEGFSVGSFNPRYFGATGQNFGNGPCLGDGCLRVKTWSGPPLAQQMTQSQLDNISYPPWEDRDQSFNRYDAQWAEENMPDGDGWSITVRTMAGALIWPYARDGSKLSTFNFSINTPFNNELAVLTTSSNQGFSQWGSGGGVTVELGPSGGVNWGFMGGTQTSENLKGVLRDGATWVGLDQTFTTTTEYDTDLNSYAVRIQSTSQFFNENGDLGKPAYNEFYSGLAYRAIYRFDAYQHAPTAQLSGDAGNPYGQDFGTLATFINGGASGRGSDTNQFPRPYDEMKALQRSIQDYLPPDYCSRIS